MNSATGELRVGIVGLGWMGQVHARAYARLPQHDASLGVRPVLTAVADTAPDDRLAAAADLWGCGVHTDWRELLERDDLDAVSVTGPNFVHRDVGVAVARSGRHLWIEKPAGRNATETAEIVAAVEQAGVRSAAGFNYRNAPAVELARRLVADGRLGRVTQVEVTLLADYSAHPDGALTWRFDRELAGTGVLGDLVSHGVDLAGYVAGAATGPVTSLVADQQTMITERPVADGAASHFSRASGGARGPVQNEDYVGALLRFGSGARGSLVASRVAVGEQCTYQLALHGDRGALRWDFRRMGELQLCLDQDPQDASWSTHLVTVADGELARFQPGTGIAMSYDDLKVIEAQRFVRSIVTGQPEGATVQDAWAAARMVEAMDVSAKTRAWVHLSAG